MGQSRPVATAQDRVAAHGQAVARHRARAGKPRTRGSSRNAPRGRRIARQVRVRGARIPRGLRERAAPSTIRADPGSAGVSRRVRPAATSAAPGGKGAIGKAGSVAARIAVAKTGETRIGAAGIVACRREEATNGAAVSGVGAETVRHRMRHGPRGDESRLDPASRFRLSPSPPRVPPPGVRFRIGRGREGRAAMRNGRSALANARRIGAAERRLPRNGNPPVARGVPTRRNSGRETGPRKGRRRRGQRKPSAPAMRIASPARRWTAFSPARASAPAPWPPSGFAKGAFV